ALVPVVLPTRRGGRLRRLRAPCRRARRRCDQAATQPRGASTGGFQRGRAGPPRTQGRRLMRVRLLFAVSALAWWLGLLAMFIPVPFTAPVSPATVIALEGSAFASILGRSSVSPSGLEVTAMNVDQGALQVHPL